MNQKSATNALDSNPPEKTFRGVQKAKKLSALKKNVVSLRQNASSQAPPPPRSPLDEKVAEFLKQIATFQNRLFQENKSKARAKRRFVCGFHEVAKLLKAEEVKMVVMATNIENFQQAGGDEQLPEAMGSAEETGESEQLDRLAEAVGGIEAECAKQNIVLVRASTKRRLARVLKKTSPVSVIGILRPEGAEELWKKVLEELAVEVGPDE